MKKTYLTILIILLTVFCYAQKSFPHNIKIRDINNKEVSSKIIYNRDKPLIITFWAPFPGCEELLNSFKEVYPEWQKDYKVKIIVLYIGPKITRKKTVKLIADNKWPFEFYFDFKGHLFSKMTKSNIIPQALIYDGSFNLLERISDIDSKTEYYREDGEFYAKKSKTNS